MTAVSVEDLQARLPEYLKQAALEGSILICRDGKTVAILQSAHSTSSTPRPLGLARGKGRILPAFFDELPPDMLNAFEGKP